MPLQATSGAASYDAFGGGVPVTPVYIEDVMSVWLYTGNGSTQTITNGIDLAGKGGLVWTKQRSSTQPHALVDTVRGQNNWLQSNTTDAQINTANLMTFSSTGYGVPNGYGILNTSAETYASWTLRRQPKFFDVVTFSGTGAQQSINHNLGSVPGCIIVKRTDTTSSYWGVYHRSLTDGYALGLNTTDAQFNAPSFFVNSASQTSTQFTVGTSANVNASGGTYVAYLFAHNAGGFGLTGTDNVISCGSFTHSFATDTTVTLGYEPQWVLIKRSDATSHWFMYDTMRSMSLTNDAELLANTSAAEGLLGGGYVYPTATGFVSANGNFSAGTYIYIAIRRGPMKVPTTGTSVFKPLGNAPASTDSGVGFPADMSLAKAFAVSQDWLISPRLTSAVLYTNSTAAEGGIFGTAGPQPFDTQDGFKRTTIGTSSYAFWAFKRAPGFFDVVCYTGTGSAATLSHNLAALPELIIIKNRGVGSDWAVNVRAINTNNWVLNLNTDEARFNNALFSSAPTSTTMTFTGAQVNAASNTYVAYLFASCPGVSKVTNFTGTGTLQTINCGFTGGARFVLIKRTDSTGNWFVWDSSRGLSSSNDPYLMLNSTAAEVTSTNWVDTTATGFQVTAASGNDVNINGASYIALAIS